MLSQLATTTFVVVVIDEIGTLLKNDVIVAVFFKMVMMVCSMSNHMFSVCMNIRKSSHKWFQHIVFGKQAKDGSIKALVTSVTAINVSKSIQSTKPKFAYIYRQSRLL